VSTVLMAIATALELKALANFSSELLRLALDGRTIPDIVGGDFDSSCLSRAGTTRPVISI
jgi:hypothetical protein